VIFATVGTHEDPFDRLVAELDRLVASGEIAEAVHVQTGYSTVVPSHCTHERMIGFDAVQDWMRRARVVVTHGGPASIMQALALGKVPIVVPRQAKFGEHVDDHQVRFSRRIAERVLVVLDIADLGPALRDHAARVASLGPNVGGPERARAFAERLDTLCAALVKR
jgi:UDP-N-acetylglucosamine transferase subunit ALG13